MGENEVDLKQRMTHSISVDQQAMCDALEEAGLGDGQGEREAMVQTYLEELCGEARDLTEMVREMDRTIQEEKPRRGDHL